MSDEKLRPRAANYLSHMLEAIRLAREYTEGIAKDAFFSDRKTQQAVILNLLIIGEAATKLVNEYPDFVATYPEIPWKPIRGMRNRMVHGYFEINLDVVWDTIRESLPKLEQQLLNLSQQLEKASG
ncbi:HepT-like ribonuclease domain-containing protein [Methylocaldum szegediense]|jgi:uncharacterized protein with HEPN domain|uniref:RNase MA_1296 n=1 Tax=Methylocaldum szegediense TaxID=73780 RepID=A0ABN8X4V4_9GAMM|nr:DUF86 domain-containing protein [Methylocaldum szegediense]CAI8832207.1 putative RNase MA_1296 [Methylocaldum szegediense]